MKISRTKFVILFLLSGFAFQFISNSLVGSEVRLFPGNGESFLGTGSPIAWKSTALYWPALALVLHYLLRKISTRKKHDFNGIEFRYRLYRESGENPKKRFGIISLIHSYE